MRVHPVLFPAYGRKYTTEKQARIDYFAGKDFKYHNGPYCSRRDFKDITISLHIGDGLYSIVYRGDTI